jgi:hypothetical protein
MTTDATYTPKDLAKDLGITPKDFRRWLRTQTDERAGRGGTWSIDEATKDILLARYRAKPARGKATTPTLKVLAVDDDELDELTEEDDVDIDELEV